jgi:hypothetical protein
VNAPPTAVAPSSPVTVAFNSAGNSIALRATDANAGDASTFAVDSPASHGSVQLTGSTATYTPTRGYTGSDSFTFKANDGLDDSAPATVHITVAPNRAPQASGASISVPFGGTTTVTLHGTDPDSDQLTYSITSQPHHGTLTGTRGTRRYKAAKGYAGTDSFSFRASDGSLNSRIAKITITVAKAPAQIMSVQFSPMHPTTGQSVRAAVTLSTPGTATGGRIELHEGSKTYWAKVSGKTASVVLGRLPAGTHNFTVRFGGTSTTHSTQVSANPLKVAKIPKLASTLHVSSSPQQLTTKSHGTAIVTVTAGRAHVDGALVTIKQGSHTLGSGTVKGGLAKVALTRLSLGQHNLTVFYAGTSTATPATQTWIVRVALG